RSRPSHLSVPVRCTLRSRRDAGLRAATAGGRPALAAEVAGQLAVERLVTGGHRRGSGRIPGSQGAPMTKTSPGASFRAALATESPLQVIGAINANHALLAQRAGFRAIYLSGGGVAAGSLGLPDLGISG